MNNGRKISLAILQASILIGIAGDFLLRETPWGLNAFLWILLISTALTVLTYSRKRDFWNKETVLLNGALLFFAATFLYRASIPLLLLNVLAIFTIAAVLTLPALRLNPKFAGVSHYILGFVWSAINVLVSPILLIFGNAERKNIDDSGGSSRMKNVFPIVRGILIVVPLLFVFGGLFMAADSSFEAMIKGSLNIDFEEIFGHFMLSAFLAWFIAGYLRGTLSGNLIPESFASKKDGAETAAKRDWREFNSDWLPNALTLGKIEIGIIWGLLNLLFLTFVLFQLSYLFGGFEYVQTTENIKLAEYARRGVAELGIVTILVLPVLLIGHWFIKREDKTTAKLFKILAGIQIGLLFVIMLSSAQRLILYTGNYGYGLTLERFYAMIFLAVLAAIFLWFAATIFSGQRRKFAWGMLWIALFTLGILNIANPEEFVLRTNFRLMQEGRNFDAHYNFSELYEDALPTAIKIIPHLNEKQKCQAENGLNMIDHYTKNGWRLKNWNYARMQAKDALDEYKKANALSGNWVKNCHEINPETN